MRLTLNNIKFLKPNPYLITDLNKVLPLGASADEDLNIFDWISDETRHYAIWLLRIKPKAVLEFATKCSAAAAACAHQAKESAVGKTLDAAWVAASALPHANSRLRLGETVSVAATTSDYAARATNYANRAARVAQFDACALYLAADAADAACAIASACAIEAAIATDGAMDAASLNKYKGYYYDAETDRQIEHLKILFADPPQEAA